LVPASQGTNFLPFTMTNRFCTVELIVLYSVSEATHKYNGTKTGVLLLL
jgi:hypothetical protein